VNSGKGSNEITEQELLDGIKVNDPHIMQSFYKRQYPTVRKFVKQNSGDDADAQDVFQEAMLAFWLNLREGRYTESGQSNAGAYVFRIAKNKWLDRLRSADYKKVNRAMSEVSDRISEISQEQKDSERIEYLKTLYSTLDDKCKKVLDMFYYERKDLESIASELGYDLGSIRTIKYRCMMKLRKEHESRINTSTH
jgi:RNA polymerase sigma factor (sigma-70 family)